MRNRHFAYSVLALATVLTVTGAGLAHAQTADAGQAAFRAIYKEMVEIDSSPTTGSCTAVVKAAEARLKAAGFSSDDVKVVIPEGKTDDGNLVAVIKGPANASKKGVLMLAHIDVVDAKRADWERDPFKLFEEGDFFYARGASDDKAMAAVFLDLMVRLKQERGFKPKRDLKIALTCGEETSNRVNGVDYLLKNNRDLIAADFAINEGAGGLLSPEGKPLQLGVQAGEKIHQVYSLEVTNPGGHSSRPVADNAIYHLASALGKVSQLQFPIELTPVVRENFAISGPLRGGEIGNAMIAVAKDPTDARAMAILAADADINPQLRTTCVGTQLEGGHAPNALPQRAKATLSCRVMQGTTPEQVQEALQKAIGDEQVKVTIERRRDGSKPPVLTDEVMGPVRAVAKKMWPGVPVTPSMTAGATDGRFLMNAGIPTYGMSGMFAKEGEFNAHGLNEKIRIKSLYEGRAFLESIVRAYVK